MYRFLLQPRWLLGFLGCVALAALCVLAGFWQFDRLDTRRAYNARVVAGREAPPVDVEQLPHLAEYRQVRAVGRFEPGSEVLIRGRTQDRQAGVYVLTPLVTDAGDRVLIVRGWVALSDRGAAVAPDVPAPPSGEVTVVGRARALESGGGGVGRMGRFPSVQRIDPASLRPIVGPALAGYVELTSPKQPGLEQVPEPDLGEGPHLAYAVQWFLFAVMCFVGYVIFARREAERRAEEAAQPASR